MSCEEQHIKLLEKQNQILEHHSKMLEQQVEAFKSFQNHVEKASKKTEKAIWQVMAFMTKIQDLAANAEMRQCQTSGEGTDACRMADCYVRGQSASISRNTEKTLVKYVIERCSGEGLRYRDVFSKKDSGVSIK